MPRVWGGKNRHRLQRELPFRSRQIRPQRVSVDIQVVPATASLVLTTFAPSVSTPRVVTPGTRALVLTTLAPTVSTPRVVTLGKVSVVLATFAPTVTVAAPSQPAVSQGGGGPPRFYLQAPRPAPRQTPRPLPHRVPTIQSRPQMVQPATARLPLRAYPPKVVLIQWRRPELVTATRSAADVFWDLNRDFLLQQIDPDLVLLKR
jgi:hypothetical protein